MPFSFAKRHCHIEKSFNGRVEMEGDQPKSACDITLSGILLNLDEFNELLEDPEAHKLHFKSTKAEGGAKLWEPRHDKIKFLALRDKYEKSLVTLYVGLEDEELDAIKLNACKIGKITLRKLTGGLTEVSMQVQSRPEDRDAAKIFANMDHDAKVSARFGKLIVKKVAQPELPMDHTGEDVLQNDLGDNVVPGTLDEARA